MSKADDLGKHAADKVQKAVYDVAGLAENTVEASTILSAATSRIMAICGAHYAVSSGLLSGDEAPSKKLVLECTLSVLDQLREKLLSELAVLNQTSPQPQHQVLQ